MAEDSLTQRELFGQATNDAPVGRNLLTPAQQLQARKDYEAGENIAPIAARNGMSQGGMRDNLLRSGTVLRPRAESIRLTMARTGCRNYRTHRVDEDYFSVIDTPAKARWLGLAASDGCVLYTTARAARAARTCPQREGMRFSISLQEGDRAHLEAFAAAIGYSGPLCSLINKPDNWTKNGSPPKRKRFSYQVGLRVSCTRLCKDLVRHGVIPRKSHHLLPWDGPDHLVRFWWAGMFDGDGVFARKSNPREWSLGLVSASLPVVEAWADFIALATGNRKAPRRENAVWTTRYCGLSTPQAIARLFFTDLQGSIPLARKADRAAELLRITRLRGSDYNPHFDWEGYTLERLESLRAECGSWRKVAELLGTTRSVVKSFATFCRGRHSSHR